MRDVPKVIAFSVLSLAIAAQAQNIYVAQSSAGGDTGADCADARALSTLTSSDWTAGNTIHLCGTITATAGTSGLVAQGSGTSGTDSGLTGSTGTFTTSISSHGTLNVWCAAWPANDEIWSSPTIAGTSATIETSTASSSSGSIACTYTTATSNLSGIGSVTHSTTGSWWMYLLPMNY